MGLALHWPCVTDSVVYPPTGSAAIEREMGTLLMFLVDVALFAFILPVSLQTFGISDQSCSGQ